MNFEDLFGIYVNRKCYGENRDLNLEGTLCYHHKFTDIIYPFYGSLARIDCQYHLKCKKKKKFFNKKKRNVNIVDLKMDIISCKKFNVSCREEERHGKSCIINEQNYSEFRSINLTIKYKIHGQIFPTINARILTLQVEILLLSSFIRQ